MTTGSRGQVALHRNDIRAVKVTILHTCTSSASETPPVLAVEITSGSFPSEDKFVRTIPCWFSTPKNYSLILTMTMMMMTTKLVLKKVMTVI